LLGLWGSRRSRVARCRRASDADFFPSLLSALARKNVLSARSITSKPSAKPRLSLALSMQSRSLHPNWGERGARRPRRDVRMEQPKKSRARTEEKKTAAAEIRRLIFSIPRRRPPLPNLPLVPRSPPQIRTCARLLAAPQSPRPAAASCSTAETRLQSRPCCASALRKTSCSIGVHGARGRECELELGSPGPRAPNSASEVETSGSMGP
jgi:hypothetical protein